MVASYFAQPGTTIRTEQHNPVFEDVGSALSSVLLRDGRAPMTGPLNMNGFPINNISAGSSPGSVATLAQAMPIGAVIDFAGTSAPAGWALCYGQAISRATYATLFALIGTTYGAGDGSTTFNLPDCRGRVAAGKDDMGGSNANRLQVAYADFYSTTLGSAGGSSINTLTQTQLPAVSPTFSGNPGSVSVHSTDTDVAVHIVSVSTGGGSFALNAVGAGTQITSTGSFTPSGTVSSFGANAPHNNIQPTIIFNKIIRVSYDG